MMTSSQAVRKWKTLPEVKQRQEEMKKKAAAAINRMNMKLYQQVSNILY